MKKRKPKTEAEKARKRELMREKRYNAPLSEADAAVIKVLPKQGEGISPFKQNAWPVRQIVQMLSDVGATHDLVTSSIRSMIHRKLVIVVELSPKSQGPGYQRTKRGEEFLREYEKGKE